MILISTYIIAKPNKITADPSVQLLFQNLSLHKDVIQIIHLPMVDLDRDAPMREVFSLAYTFLAHVLTTFNYIVLIIFSLLLRTLQTKILFSLILMSFATISSLLDLLSLTALLRF